MVEPVIAALGLPEDARVDRRVPKKLLLENGAPTSADKRVIQDGIDGLIWVAALKPTNMGVPDFRDEVREYLEIAVITAELSMDAKASRLVELMHRAIPYPLVLLAGQGGDWTLSVAHKRWSQGEKGKVVIEDVHCTAPFRPDALTAEERSFLASLAVSGLPRGDLFALYQGWIDRVAAMAASRITGAFAVPAAVGLGDVLRDGLEAHRRIERDLVLLRAQAKKEKQISRRVDLNLRIKRLEGELSAIAVNLGEGGT